MTRKHKGRWVGNIYIDNWLGNTCTGKEKAKSEVSGAGHTPLPSICRLGRTAAPTTALLRSTGSTRNK